MKHCYLGVLIAGVTFSISAFANVQNSVRFSKIYYHVGSQYILAEDLPVSLGCEPVVDLPCAIIIKDVDTPSIYPIPDSEIPSIPYIQLGTNEGTHQ